IKFNVPQNGNVKLIVTNAVGQEIETLFNGFMEAGNHSQTFDAQNLTSGIYFYTLTTNSGSLSKKMMLIK
ncbi:MAG: T9SS type A sorting domain-containing protein, partial [Syntrophothermus sp.]